MDTTPTYFYCKQCNKGIDSKIGRCEDCGKRFNGKTISRTFTKEQIDELIQQSLQEMEAASTQAEDEVEQVDESIEDGEMLCLACGKRFDVTHSVCTCGAPLMLDYKEAVEITEEPVQSADGEVYGEILENPTWKLKVRRYRNFLPEEGTKEIFITRNITAIGRVYLALNHIFTYNVKEDQNSIVNVSKFNAVFLEEDGRLYIQYDNLRHQGFAGIENREKAPIFVNGRRLEKDQRFQLTAGDSVTMGNGADLNMNLCVEFIVQNQRNSVMWQEGSLGKMETLMSELNDRMDYNVELQKQILDQSTEIKGNIKKLTHIQIDDFSTIKSYMQTLQEYEVTYKQEDTSKTTQDYIDIYLKNNPDPEAFLRCLNQDQTKYLGSAAFFDYMLEENEKTDIDCSGIFINLGKLLEDFLNEMVVIFMETYCKGQWYKTKSHYNIGDFTKALERDMEARGTRMYQQIARDVNNARGYRYTNEERVREAFAMFDRIREIRNAAAHSLIENIFDDKITRVDYPSYQMAKRYLLETTYLVDITNYHQILF